MTTPEELLRYWQERSPYRVTISEDTMATGKHFSPSAARNAEPIADALSPRLPEQGRALEIASGTGQHVVAFAERFAGIRWTPSDVDREAKRSIEAWCRDSGLANLDPPRHLDVMQERWEAEIEPGIDALVVINLLHISPWPATEGLLRGAARLLAGQGNLFIYGAFKRDGRHIAQSNESFDESLKFRDPAWGVRDIAEVETAARPHGLKLKEVISLPANNLLLVLGPMQTAGDR